MVFCSRFAAFAMWQKKGACFCCDVVKNANAFAVKDFALLQVAMEEDATDAGGSSAMEQEEVKKASSYRYWVRSEMTGAAPAPLPRKLTEREMVVGNGKPLPLGSLWNQAGTWEEKSLNSWAWKRIKDLLQGVEPVEFEDGKAQVVEVSSCSGDATLVTVRQKKRVGYSFEIDMKVKMEVSTDEGLKKDVEGTMKVPEACYGELDDLQLEISITQSQIADAAQRSRVTQALVASFLPAIRCKLEQFETELKER